MPTASATNPGIGVRARRSSYGSSVLVNSAAAAPAVSRSAGGDSRRCRSRFRAGRDDAWRPSGTICRVSGSVAGPAPAPAGGGFIA
jgi:hypothetical protein